MPEGAARGRMDEGDEVAPVVARLDGRQRAVPRQGPDAFEQRFQADAMLVGRPPFDGRFGKRWGHRTAQSADPPLKASCSSALAATWCGRGWRCRALRRCK